MVSRIRRIDPAYADRRTARALPGHTHDAGRRLGERVVTGLAREGATRPESADVAPDQSWLLCPERLRCEAEAVEKARPEVLNDRVSLLQDESPQRLNLVLAAEVNGDVFLAPVETHE